MSNQVWHNFSVDKIFTTLKSSKKGLTKQQVKRYQQKFGFNRLSGRKPTPKLFLLLNQIRSPLVYVLLVAVVISTILGHYTDAGVIFFIVVVNSFFGYWQESKADDAMQKLRRIVKDQAKVLRNGAVCRINAEELVPGDIVFLSMGDKVPADARLIEINDLKTNESALTGESSSVQKELKLLDKGTSLADRKNMVYMGTSVARGKGTAMVCATGANTEIGQIGKLISEAKEDKTPLQYQLAKFSRTLTFIIVAVCFLIFIQGFATGKDLMEMFLTVVALAVAAIPEGLLVAVTIILTVGMQFILKRKALVRKLIAAETLGSTSIICTDKTGTLTEGKMRVSKIITADGDYTHSKTAELTETEKARYLISKISVLCSNAVIGNPGAELEKLKIIGDPTETALLLASTQSGFDKARLDREYKKLGEIPFDSQNKYMATIHSHSKDGHEHVFIKGAPEKIFGFCSQVLSEGHNQKLDKEQLKNLKRKYESLTKKGLRVLAFAYKTGDFKDVKKELNELVFLGFVALKDPLRADAKEAINLCQQAGIRPIMITGDHKLTAKAIFEELGFKVNNNIVEGKDLDKWSDAELRKRVDKIDIYARVEPKHKLRVVDAWQARGEVVAMTGDGINDAPAIKTADIGIALGSGSDVTKETADIVLLDDNFKVIVAAVEQGRVIFENIRKVILYLLSDSFSEIVLIAGSLILGLPLPILATQILWINLVADGLPNIAMALEPGEKEVMDDPPRPKNEPILNREMKVLIFAIGIITDIILLVLFMVLLRMFVDIDYVRTIIFVALGIDSLLYVFSVRSLRHSIFTKNPFSNKYLIGAVLISFMAFFLVIYIPWLQVVFHTVALGWKEWVLVLILATVKIFLIEIVKHRYIVKKMH
ncbi:MAG: HAD-IC family P-type ATPase [bacterium]